MPTAGTIGRPGKMDISGYRIYIDRKTVSDYIDSESLETYKEMAEGEAFWEYWTEDVSFEMDISGLYLFGLNTSNYYNLYKKYAEVWQHGRLIFSGCVGEIKLNGFDESIEIVLYSKGRVLKDIKISSAFSVTDRSIDGTMASLLFNQINPALQSNGYPFNIIGSKIDVFDFAFYRTMSVTSFDMIPDLVRPINGNLTSIPKQWARGLYKYGSDYYLGYSEKGDLFTLVLMTSNGPNYSSVKYDIDSNDLEYMDKNDFEDQGVVEYVEAHYKSPVYVFGSLIYLGSSLESRDASVFYAFLRTSYVTKYLVRIEIVQDDIFTASYDSGEDVTSILRDFAIMTNSILHIGVDGYIYYQSRDGIPGLTQKKIYDIDSELLIKQGVFDPPSAFILLDSVKNDLINYYNQFLNGKFKKVTALIDRGEFSYFDYPLLLKKLPLPYQNNGYINAIEYDEYTLKIETEEYING